MTIPQQLCRQYQRLICRLFAISYAQPTELHLQSGYSPPAKRRRAADRQLINDAALPHGAGGLA